MHRLRRYWGDIAYLVGLLLLPLLLFGDVTLGGKTMLPADVLFQWAPWSVHAAEFGIGAPQNGLIGDLIIQNYAWKQFIRETVLAGDIPLWNPYLFAGAPFLAVGQHGAYYPFSLLFLALPLSKAYGWYTVTQIWLAGITMYGYGRILRLSRPAAFLAALTYQGGGFLIVSAAVFPMISGAVVWLPLLLGCIEAIVRWPAAEGERPSTVPGTAVPILWIALGAVALGVQILAGHIEYTIYTLLVMALYAAWRLLPRIRPALTDRSARRTLLARAGQLAAMVAVGLMLGAIQLIPLYEVGQVNFRQGGAPFETVLSYGYQPRRLLTLALPNFFGNPSHGSYRDALSGEEIPFTVNANGQPKTNSEWGLKNYVEGGIYLGILPLFLAGLGIWSGWRYGRFRRWQTAFYLLLGGLSLTFIFGTPLYALIYYGIPFTNQLNTPFRWVFPFSLSVAVLAGFGAERLSVIGKQLAVSRQPSAVSRQRPLTINRLPFTIHHFLFLSGALLLLALWLSRAAYGRFESLIQRLFTGLANATAGFPDARAFYSYTFWQLLTLGLLLLGVGAVFWLARRSGRGWVIAAAALLIADIFLANRGFHAAVDPALLNFEPQLVTWLHEQPGEWRLTSYTPRGDIPFNANSAWLTGLQDVRGYDSIIPRQYVDFMQVIEPQGQLPFNRVQPIFSPQALESPLLDVLNVKYVITTESELPPKFALAWEGEGVRVYENLAVAPRAYTLPQTATAVAPDPLAALREWDPRQVVIVQGETAAAPQPAALTPANIVSYSNREVVVETAVADPSWLLLNDSHFPGWNAFARPSGTPDAEETELDVTLVNGNFRGVRLEPGQWTVRFRYSPPSFWLGGLTSLMGGIILAFALAVAAWRRFYRPESAQSKAGSIAKNSLAPMALNLFNKGIDFALAIYYLRVLGPANAGSYQTAITTALIFEIIANYGLDILLIRDVSQAREKASHYLLNTTLLRLGAGVVAALPVAALIVGGQVLGTNPLTTAEVTAIVLIMIGMIFSGMSKGVTGLFYVYEQAEVPAAMTTVTTILRVGFSVGVLLVGWGFVGLAAVSIPVNIITLTILATIALRRFAIRGPWRVDGGLLRRMVVAGFPLMLIHLLQTIFISVDVLLLRLQLGAAGPQVVGWYSSAYKWFNALQIVPSFFTMALFPIISREIQTSLDAARRMYELSLKIMLLLALPVAAVTVFLATPLVQLLAGSEFLPHGAIALQLVILSIPFGWMNSVTNYVLIGLGLERIQPRAFAAAVLFNVVTNLIFIPLFSYRAAAVTTILSEVVLGLLFAAFLRQRMPGVQWGRLLARPFLAAALMGAALYLGGQLHLLLGLALGLVTYPAALLLLGALGAEERRVLGRILPGRIGNWVTG